MHGENKGEVLRVCASYYTNENMDIPLKLAHLPQ